MTSGCGSSLECQFRIIWEVWWLYHHGYLLTWGSASHLVNGLYPQLYIYIIIRNIPTIWGNIWVAIFMDYKSLTNWNAHSYGYLYGQGLVLHTRRIVYCFRRTPPSPAASNSQCWVLHFWPRRSGSADWEKVKQTWGQWIVMGYEWDLQPTF